MGEDTGLYEQLHKLSGVESEEKLQHILNTLWRTRKTGLNTPDKASIQSLLNLPSMSQLDPVLACLRSLIRKYVHQNFAGDDVLKLLPPDLSLDLQNMLVMALQKCQNLWKEEISKDQNLLPRATLSHQVRAGLPPAVTSFPTSEMTALLWPRQDESVGSFVQDNLGASVPVVAESGISRSAVIPLKADVGACNLESLPRLKSMTWTLENCNTARKKVAIVTLKLQDYANTPLGEKEVKFQLTRDTLEAMLKSMAYISEQLACHGGSGRQSQKKQRH